MSRPDIALISPWPGGGAVHAGGSGVASYTANLAGALAEQGARVAVVAPRGVDDPALEERDGIRVRRAFSVGPAAVMRAVRCAEDTGAPVVHLQQELFLYGGAASLPGMFGGLRRLRRRGRPRVVTAHQVVDPGLVDRSFVDLHRMRVPAFAARRALAGMQTMTGRLSTRVVVHERGFTKHIPRSLWIPHGIETPGLLERDAARARLGVPGDEFTVLCFGFVAPYKGLEHALEAGEAAGSPVRVVVAGGEHPRHSGSGYSAGLRARWGGARFTGYVAEEEVSLWFAASDVALLPYPHPHASSGVLALALAHGTPFLVSPALADCTAAPAETVVPLDALRIGRRLRSLAGDPAAVESLRRACSGMASGRAWPEVARRHLQLYQEVIREPGLARDLPDLVSVR